MTSKSRWPALVCALVVVTLSGCAAAPSSSPSPGFTSEAEAFAAAEKTYRAYVDALNDVDLSNPDTFEAVYAWTTGELNASDRETFSLWHSDGLRKSGASKVVSISRSSIESETVTLDVCYDVSEVQIVSPSGASLVEPDRPSVQDLRVGFVPSSTTATRLALTSISPAAEGTKC